MPDGPGVLGQRLLCDGPGSCDNCCGLGACSFEVNSAKITKPSW